MFSFFHRTSVINLDCFTSDNTVYTTTPIVRASKAFPDWWKKLSPYKLQFEHSQENPYHPKEEMTARDCYAIIELYKKGIIIENWCDISFRTEDGLYNYWYTHGEQPQDHPREQFNGAFPYHHHLKLLSPWGIRETTGIKFAWMGAEWSLDSLEIKVLPGIVSFDIMSQINVNIMFPIRNNVFTIPVGNPLVHIIPLSDKKLKVTNHLVTKQEYAKIVMNSRTISFYGWRKSLELIKRNRKRGTCPFHGDNNDKD
jgi:hypothetical protein